MNVSRDDFVIAIRSAFLKKQTKQKFSLLSLIILSVIILILSSFDYKVIKVVRSGKVRRAKLYYLRERKGKSARIAEKIKKKIGIDVSAEPTETKNIATEIKAENKEIKKEISEEKSEVENKLKK